MNKLFVTRTVEYSAVKLKEFAAVTAVSANSFSFLLSREILAPALPDFFRPRVNSNFWCRCTSNCKSFYSNCNFSILTL